MLLLFQVFRKMKFFLLVFFKTLLYIKQDDILVYYISFAIIDYQIFYDREAYLGQIYYNVDIRSQSILAAKLFTYTFVISLNIDRAALHDNK